MPPPPDCKDCPHFDYTQDPMAWLSGRLECRHPEALNYVQSRVPIEQLFATTERIDGVRLPLHSSRPPGWCPLLSAATGDKLPCP